MKISRNFFLLNAAAAALSLSMAGPASAGCNIELEIKNAFNVPINIDKIQTSNPLVPIYRTRWDQTRNIPAGATSTVHFNTTTDCTVLGTNQTWDMKIFRTNGKVHQCFNVDDDDRVTLRKATACST